MVEQRSHNPSVGGSNPSPATVSGTRTYGLRGFPAAVIGAALVLVLCPACATRGGEEIPGWPVLGNGVVADFDESRVIDLPGSDGSAKLLRTDFSLAFQQSVDREEKAAFFARHVVTVIGETPFSLFYIRIADPGPDIDALYAVLDSLRADPVVEVLSVLPAVPLIPGWDARYPDTASPR